MLLVPYQYVTRKYTWSDVARVNRVVLIAIPTCFYLFLSALAVIEQRQTLNRFYSEHDVGYSPDSSIFSGHGRTTRPYLVIANNSLTAESDCTKKATRQRITETAALLPTTSLLSAHGSGSNWMRWLIERLTGICTGSVYQERQMTAQGFKCELGAVSNGLTIVQKSHYFYHHNSTKVLLLVRYPLDAFVSDYHRSKTAGNHTGLADSSVFANNEWNDFVIERTGEWISLITTALMQSQDLLVVFYENLQNNLERELTRVAAFLQVYVSSDRVHCVMQNKGGNLRRKRGSQGAVGGTLVSVASRVVLNDAVVHAVDLFNSNAIPNIPKNYVRLKMKE